MSALSQLQSMTTIVADTGDLSAIARLKPVDATTNPSLITKALTHPDKQAMLSDTLNRYSSDGDDMIDNVIDNLTIQVGCDILKLIDGRVSTEVDARLSYDTEATIAKAVAEGGHGRARLICSHASINAGVSLPTLLAMTFGDQFFRPVSPGAARSRMGYSLKVKRSQARCSMK